jgi:uncharacterized membrane protein (Fun14 family)
MITEGLIPTVTSVSGGFFIGVVLGYFVKKITKILMFAAGGIVGLLLCLQQQEIITVNLEKLENSSTIILNSVATSFENITQIGDAASLGIPLTGGLSAGLVIGFMKG